MVFILALIGLFAPRFLIVVLWLFSNWFSGVFGTRFWPILGFIFLPFTLLWYSVVQNWWNGDWNWWRLAILVIAILADFRSDGAVSGK